MIAPRIIAPENNSPRRKLPLPGYLLPRIIAAEDHWSPDNFPLDDCPRIIAPGQLLQR